MMRSMYSGIAGLKAHQTKMDVIGNNIANVNTAGFKASNVVFSDVYYQTMQNATGADPTTGTAGQNAKQIGIGSKVSSIAANMTTQGGAQATDNAMDLMLSGDSFFIVNRGGTNYFTKAGAFNVDGAGNLCTASGDLVMGWDTDENGEVIQSQVKALDVMAPENLYSKPAPTTKAYLSGNIDATDTQLTGEGVPYTVSFYDNLGYSYTAVFSVKQKLDTNGNPLSGQYSATLTNILDADSKSILVTETVDANTKQSSYALNANLTPQLTNSGHTTSGTIDATNGVDKATGEILKSGISIDLAFDPSSGKFKAVGGVEDTAAEDYGLAILKITGKDATEFPTDGIKIDFSSLTQYSTSGTSSVTSTRGDKLTGEGAGTAFGNMKGLRIDAAGLIYGTYDNGTKKCLGQIAVTDFANPAGLEAIGGSLFAETQNSGEFDGIGKAVTNGGGSMSSGYLEMSNVDLSTEFTNMITTQRGFQANSRIITTSDTLLEELVNLKR